jgi:hypothetical protein
MKRSGLAGLVVVWVVGAGVGAGCSGGAKAKPQPTLAAGEGEAETAAPGAVEQEIAAPPVDPTLVPAGTVATISIGDPAAAAMDLSAYLTTAGFIGAPAMLATTMGMTGLALDKPIALIVVLGDAGPEPAIAGTAADDGVVQRFAQMGGLSAEIDNGLVVIARLEQQDRLGPHLRWRLAQPVPAELRFEIASEMVNQLMAVASMSMPNNPLSGFDSIAKLTGSVGFAADAATLKLVVDARPDTGLAKFTTSLAPSDFRLAGVVAAPGDMAFAASTMDLRLMTETFRNWMGPTTDLWTAVAEQSDGASAFVLSSSGDLVSVIGVKPGSTAAAAVALEEMIGKLKTPVEHMNQSTVGRPRVKKIAKQWFHEMEVSMSATAPESDRESMKLVWGTESLKSLLGVADDLAITAAGKGTAREKAIGRVLARAKASRGGAAKIANAGAAAAVEEAKLASEAFVLTGDIAAFVEKVLLQDAAPAAAASPPPAKGKKAAPAPSREQFRMGMGRFGESLALRFVLPAPQLSAIREAGVRMATP